MAGLTCSHRLGPSSRAGARAPLPARGKFSDHSQWSLDAATGHLVCQGDGGHEWLRWDKELADCIFHVEWRFTVVPGKKGYNSGVYARNSADAKIWHQAQTGDASGGYLFGNTLVKGQSKRFNLSKQQTGSRVKPAGEWNVFEITCRGKEMTLWVNGRHCSIGGSSVRFPKDMSGSKPRAIASNSATPRSSRLKLRQGTASARGRELQVSAPRCA